MSIWNEVSTDELFEALVNDCRELERTDGNVGWDEYGFISLREVAEELRSRLT